jgi:hypothetical protein
MKQCQAFYELPVFGIDIIEEFVVASFVLARIDEYVGIFKVSYELALAHLIAFFNHVANLFEKDIAIIIEDV